MFKKKIDKVDLGMRLMNWHGGQHTGLYAVASTLYANNYDPDDNSLRRAYNELMNIRNDALFPQYVKDSDVETCERLAKELATLFPQAKGG